MNVWIINPFDNLPTEGHRPQRYWLMSRAFAEAGDHVRFWTSDFSHATKKRRESKSKCEVEGVECEVEGVEREVEVEDFAVELLPTKAYPTNVCWQRIVSHRALAKTFVARAREVIASGEKPDLVIASTPPLGLCAAAMEVAKSCGAKFGCDIQDAWPETFYRLLPCGCKWLGAMLFAGMRRTARRIYREADLVTGVCRRYAELSGRDDFHLAYLGIESGGVVEQEVVRGGKSRLAYVGNLGVGYDLGTVIAAVARRAELTLDIAGLGPREAELRTLVARLGVGERVRFHGYLGEDALRALMASCDVGVIPMRDDSWVGLPNKLGDYLAAGLQVVSSLHGECGELLLRTGYGQVYDWQSVDSLLAALDALRPTEVTLPDELRAEQIYPAYVCIFAP